MNKITKRTARLALGAVMLGMSIGAMAAWPERPITLVVPFPPGGNTDALARLVGQHLSAKLG
ncbi:MAG: tripartite tricarboxylate transporter substrate binding protein, partial [Herminiimonas sp.]|nr:tripartite tricarboxylate transporter substrate binding protein [Herminiimonas sp.]MDB5853663.1 tripartite tricarboxylate transporter substrate binding protein [Herminiimonas sp.]